jgi:methylated-DNA-[protein]-cysteine S-methyltransferase
VPPRDRRERQPHRLRRRARAQGAAAAARGCAALRIVASERGLQRLDWSDGEDVGPRALVEAARAQLDEYFAGARKQFELPLDFAGTEFQRRAWLALAEIPYGETRSYAEQARLLRTGARAVGSANARNPLPIVLPCHRLVGRDGGLTGYGGGLELKGQLLRLEGATSPSAPRRTGARRR